jgi:hypothetical protein
MYREICAFFLFDCSQWEVVWDLFDRGGKQTQCPLGGLRKLENIVLSRSSLKGTHYAYYSQQCGERKNDFLPFLSKGNVPPEIGTFGDFFGVQTLNASGNQLTGIPYLLFP